MHDEQMSLSDQAPLPVSWHVCGVPPAATAVLVGEAFAKALGPGSGRDPRCYPVALTMHTAFPYAYVTPTSPLPLDEARLRGGIDVCGVNCAVKKRRESKAARLERSAVAAASKQLRQRHKVARWQAQDLDRFPRRESCLCQHAMVASLEPSLLAFLQRAYLPARFERQSAEVGASLRWVFERHPDSLRVKELFETVEAFSIIEQQVALINARASARGSGDGGCVQTIYDLACGHGLLGVLFAYRFAGCAVVCVDLERRPCFDHYVEGFRACCAPDALSGEKQPLSNLAFHLGDMAELRLEPHSFVACVHACNEANVAMLELAAAASAAYAAMPCCVRSGLYGVCHRHVEDDVRHATMVGMVAGRFEAHTLTAIDRKITNRNLLVLGGYEPIAGGEAARNGEARGRTAHTQRTVDWHGRSAPAKVPE